MWSSVTFFSLIHISYFSQLFFIHVFTVCHSQPCYCLQYFLQYLMLVMFSRREELEYVNSNVAGEQQILGGGYHHVINPSTGSGNDIYGTGDYDQLAAGIDNYAENPYHLYSLVDDRNLDDSNVKGFANGGGV